MIGRLKDLTVNRDGTQNITVTVDADFAETFDALKDKPVTVEIKKASKKRSLTANSFCWALCDDIAKAFTPPQTKEDIYRAAIKAVGVWWEKEEPIFAIEKARRRWESGGVGWFTEIVDNGRPGRKILRLYFGTSTYTSDEMRVLIDWLVDQARQMELPIPLSQKQTDELIERWGKRVTNTAQRTDN